MNPPEDQEKKENNVSETVHLEDYKADEPDDSAPQAGNSLEGPSSADEPVTSVPSEDNPLSKKPDSKPSGTSNFGKVKSFIKRFDIYFLVFILITIVALILSAIALNKNNANKTPSTNSQSLSQSALSQLNSSDTQVGNPQQTLNIESNAVFAHGVLVKGGLEVAGTVKFAGDLTIPGLTVSGNSAFNQISGSSLILSGDSTINGNLTVKQNLSVSGTSSFGGNVTAPLLTVSTLQVNGPFQISHHLTTSGSIPKDTAGTLGSGGTTNINGNDQAGTVNIGLGSGVFGDQCLATITFTSAYSSTPRVMVTPVGSASGNIGFYITDTSSSFSICGHSLTGAPGSLSFNYFVID